MKRKYFKKQDQIDKTRTSLDFFLNKKSILLTYKHLNQIKGGEGEDNSEGIDTSLN